MLAVVEAVLLALVIARVASLFAAAGYRVGDAVFSAR
jgi:hypothetical protein